MRDQRDPLAARSELELAQDIALKAATDILAQAEFASIDASDPASLNQAAKRFGAILHYAERALNALERVEPSRHGTNSVQ